MHLGNPRSFLSPNIPFFRLPIWWESVRKRPPMKRFRSTPNIDNMEPKLFTGMDGGTLVASTHNGFQLYLIQDPDKLELIYTNEEEKPRIVERLPNTNLVAIVPVSSPRKLRLFHFKKAKEICSYNFPNSILAIRMNRVRLVVCLEDRLYIYALAEMRVLHVIKDTPPNSLGICALGVNHTSAILAYPGSVTTGDVNIFDVDHLSAKIMIPAHHSTVAALAVSPNSTRLGTASEKGTIIRVFSVANGHNLFEFRRGVKRCVDIACLVFSACGQFLCCSSNTETVHVFKFEGSNQSPKVPLEDNSWMTYFSSYLPTPVSNVLTQDRAFAVAYLPIDGLRSSIVLTIIRNQMRLLVATESNCLYIYTMDPNLGGELTMTKYHNVFETPKSGEVAAFDQWDLEAEKLKDLTIQDNDDDKPPTLHVVN